MADRQSPEDREADDRWRERLAAQHRARDERLVVARHLLVRYMSDMSEDHYCAGWLSGWENMCRRFAGQVETLALDMLQEAAGGWWPSSFEDADPYLSSIDTAALLPGATSRAKEADHG